MDAVAALERVVAALPGGGEARPGQVEMTAAVERAVATGRHLVVQAGTGTGKSLGYLVPAVLSGKRVVVVTATKALQDQLSTKDLPFLAEHLDHDFTYAVLKGRSNYLCLQRAKEAISSDEQLGLEGMADRTVQREVERLVRWGTETATGDRAELLFEPTDKGWATVSVGARECPGALRCPMGEVCFCERAREAAVEADIVVVNAHLYGLHVASDGAVLPEHDVVVFDEAHQLEDVVAATAGLELGPSRFTGLAKAVRALIADDALIAEIDAAGEVLASALVEHLGRRLRGQPTSDLARALDVGRSRVERAMKAVRNAPDPGNADVDARKQRATKLGTALLEELAAVTEIADTDVAWVEGPAHNPVLKVAPVDVSRTLAARLWPSVTAILTSATIPPALAARLGIESEHDELDVGSPFDFEANAVLYCAAHLPDPRNDAYTAAVHDELTALIRAAGGRTLALFTSWRAMTAAADALTPVLKAEGIPVLTQSQLPKAALLNAFSADEATCLFATMSFWQGVDIAGRSLSLVVVDRLPFPRPDEPLMQARRELARGSAFAAVDLPRASTLLAQGAGRLIRTATDRGVVAVLDPRLASASYRWAVINALPPMRRTRDRAVVESFLREITAAS